MDRTKDEAGGLRVELTGPWAAYSFSGFAEEDARHGASAGEGR